MFSRAKRTTCARQNTLNWIELDKHGVRLSTKVAVYRAVVLTTLLFGSETWTTCQRYAMKLGSFHLRCLRQIAGIEWEYKVPNTVVLAKCGLFGIEATLPESQMRRSEH